MKKNNGGIREHHIEVYGPGNVGTWFCAMGTVWIEDFLERMDIEKLRNWRHAASLARCAWGGMND